MPERSDARHENLPAGLTRPESADADAGALAGELDSLRRQLRHLRVLETAVGRIYSRGPGLRGWARFLVKKGTQIALAWYTRSLHQFQMATTRMAEEQTSMIGALAARVTELERRICDLESGCSPNRLKAAAHPEAATSSAVAARDLGGERGSRPLPFGLNVIGYLSSEKGLGEAVRCNLRTCKASGIPYVANSFVDVGSKNIEAMPENFSTENPYGINLVNVNADEMPKVMERHPEYHKGRYNIGFWAWELPSFPEEWYGCFGYLDEVWVPSRFVQAAVEEVSTVPVHCIPHSIDPELRCSPAGMRRQLGIPEDVFLFLFFFDFHSQLERKNPGGLIRAFRQAFGARKDVMLLIKSSHGRFHQGDLWRLRKAGGGANIRIIDGILPRAGMYSLVGEADAYVSLHRSEGFGLTLSEAMACGKPVIATGYSGNMDFMTPSNSFPVRFRTVEIDRDHGPYRKGNIWADPDVDHAAELMLRVAEDRSLAAQVARQGKADVREKLHPDTIAKAFRGRLEAIARSIGIAR
jgi:glycosyltransferase involved in cell wall biosynthesis